MRPLRSFLLLLVFLIIFTGLHYISPLKDYFPPLTEFIPAEYLKKKSENQVDSVPFTPDTIRTLTIRSTPDSVAAPMDSAVFAADSTNPVKDLAEIIHDSLNASGSFRIMYYGDSQIEGDRVTAFLRKHLRSRYDGTGPGLLQPVMPVMYTETAWIRSSSNWKRFNYLTYLQKEISHRRFGPFLSVCRYLPEGVTSAVPEKATVRIRPARMADSAAAVYEVVRVIYSNPEGPVNLRITAGDTEIFNDTLEWSDRVSEIKALAGARGEIILEFTGRVSPDVYAISIEGNRGIQVDNLPQRGSAGLEFTMVERQNLAEVFELLSPDVIVLQYGLNLVRNVKDDYTSYRLGLERQLRLLRETAPGARIIVAGLTDMAEMKGDSLIPFPNIPAIIEAQKDAAAETGTVFWNSWEAMGGEGSVIRWASSNPPLAARDYTHLTYTGADSLASLMASDLFTERLKDTSATMDSIRVKAVAEPSEPLTQREALMIRGMLTSLFSYDPAKPFIFTAPAFWLFFLIVLAGYSFIYKKLYLRNFYLFLASMFFYYKSGGLFLFLLILVTVVDFMCGLLIGKSEKKPLRRMILLLSIISNLGILAYFKYTGFISETINTILGTNIEVHDYLAAFSNMHFGTAFNISDIILPVGVSFFTFQSLSYTFDVYRRKIAPVTNVLDFGFYVSFFPQLVAGPIVRASEFIPQIYAEFHLSKREFSHALYMIMKGLVKKVIISDFIAIAFIDRVFEAPSMYSGFENLMAVYGYGLQIYCDFSGYTDIAIGLGLILGFRLPVNFNSPYKASDVQDFWKRWHISLSRWLRDYLYIPLGGNRKGKIRTGINLMITMLLGGLWHGASMRFVIWGALHGAGLILSRAWRSVTGLRAERGFMRLAGIILTFNFVSFCWIFFRAPDMENISIMLSQIFGNFSPGLWNEVIPAYGKVFVIMAAGYLLHFLPEPLKEMVRGAFINIPLAVKFLVVLAFGALLYNLRAADAMPFIYFRF